MAPTADSPTPHVDPDDLAVLALGEHVDGVDEAHLSGCPTCQGELDRLRAVVGAARTVTAQDAPAAPPERVWAAVAAELALDDAPAPDAVPLRGAPSRRTALLATAAALVGLLVGSVVTGLVVAAHDRSGATVVARTVLAALPDHTGSGDAEVVGTGSSRVLQLDVSGLTKGDGYYEVWLLDSNGKRLVSLGLLDGDRASFPLPPQVDVASFPVVDVSLEPADGNPAHSGNSIVRGTLGS